MEDQNYIDMKLNESLPEKKQNKNLPYIIIAILFILILLILLFSRVGKKSDIPEFMDGYITVGTASSPTYSDLFYKSGEKYLIDLEGLDKTTNLDTITTSDGLAVNNIFDQVFVSPGYDYYYVNSNKISDDDNYTAPVVIDEKVYADTDIILNGIGYDTTYNFSADKSVIELKIDVKDKDRYYTVIPNKELEKDEEDEIAEMPQAEEGAIENPGLEVNRPGEELQTVPRPEQTKSEDDKKNLPVIPSETEAETNPEETEGMTEVPSEIEEIEETTVAQEPEEPAREYNPNRKTDEEFEAIWAEDKEELKNIFENSTPNFKQDAYKELSSNFVGFNIAHGAIYGNTISVIHDTTSGEFLYISFNGDWSDQANNITSEESRAYYLGVPEVYRKTLVTCLGENVGTELFNYIKAHGDRTITGGYVARVNPETKAVESVWTDGEVGNGVDAQHIDFEAWQDRTTDNGLRFDVVRNGNGIDIFVYYD